VRFLFVKTWGANLKINVARELPIDYQAVIDRLKGIDKVIFVGGISAALEGEEMPVDIEGFKGGGCTYRYFSDPLFAFGYGLSYTTFRFGQARLQTADDRMLVSVPVTNAGSREGTEVVQLYVRNLQDPDGPLKSLRAFQRVSLKAGQTQTVTLTLSPRSFEFWDPETNTMRTKPGDYELLIGNSSRDEDL